MMDSNEMFDEESQAEALDKTARDYRARTQGHKRHCRCPLCLEGARLATLSLLVEERASRRGARFASIAEVIPMRSESNRG